MQQIFDVATVKNIVVICERDVFAMGMIQAGVLGLGDTSVFLMYDMDSGILRGILVAYCRRPVGGAIVDQNHLEIGV